jgi:ABC-2 type transport system permease protein
MVKSLVKNRFKALFYQMLAGRGRGKKQKASLGSIILFACIYLYLAFAFIFLSSVTAISLGTVLIPLGASWLYFAMFSLIDASLIFILGIFETKSEIFESRDNELLLSMPIKASSIVCARIVTVLIFNYIESAVITLPAAIVYAVLTGFEARGFFGCIAVGFFVPLFATALSSAVGYLLSLLTRRIKNKTFFTVAFALIFIFAYMFGYSKLIKGFEDFLANIGNNVDTIASDYPIIYYLGTASLLKIPSLTAVILISVSLFVLACCLISKSYIALVNMGSSTKKAVYKGRITQSKSALFALTKKELCRFKSSSVYIVNSSMGLIFGIILSAVALVKRQQLLSGLDGMGITSEYLAPLLIMGLVFIGAMTMISCCALSLEGNHLWIIKTMPINAKTVLLSKLLPHILIGAVPNLISSVLLYAASSSSIYFLPLFILIPQLANIEGALIGLVFNTAFPKFHFDNDAQVVKQGLPTLLTILTQSLLDIGLIVLCFVLIGLSPLLAAASCLAVLLLLSVLLYFILFKYMVRKYDRIEV